MTSPILSTATISLQAAQALLAEARRACAARGFAASFGMATHQWNQYMAEPAVAPLAHHPRLTPVGGGVPIFHEGRLVGGIGVSGGTSAQDHEAAEEALRQAGFNQ